eukprot:CAMPEP_0184555222 /NCGR_PEP_ID=MMETSP0199_2-20130426/37037_1 /TAXON_ID=1112570 /ORGANISM="Thraustochytrium sp., Strain LLF1b" /LENGTH=897 /DNA_ID=CAMNT_0026951493 /DNA_START=364 /DNA_END=3054 /DNA_ORIENTATION=+
MMGPEDTAESLAVQLSAQVSYTNDLLQQLQEQEQQQLNAQRDVQSKQQALRQAMAVCDSVRADQAELRKKHAMAQELANRAAADAKRWKVECDVRAKEVEGLEKFAAEARGEIEQLRSADERKTRRIAELEADRAKLSDQLERYAIEEEQRMAKHRESFELLSRELAELKAAHSPLKNEVIVLRARNEELERSFKQRDADIRRYQEDIDRAKRRVTQLEESERHMHLLEAQFKSDLHNEQSKAQRTQQQVEAAQAIASAREQELENARMEANELKQSTRALQDENRSLRGEIETLGNDLLGQSQALSVEKERWEGRTRELQEELSRVVAESRERERGAAENLRMKMAEFSEQRRSLESQNERVQSEYRQLHDLLQRTQNEKESQSRQLEIAREELESRVTSTQDRARSIEEESSRKEAEYKRDSALLLAEIQRLQSESLTSTSNEMESFGMLHSTIQELAAECIEQQELYAQAMQEIDNLRADVANHKRNGAVALQDWHTDTKRALADLGEANNRTRMKFEETRDAQLEAEVQRDEERAKNLMLTEERRRLEDEVSYLRQNVQSLEQASRERLENARLEYESATAEQDGLEKRCRMLSQQVEELNSQNRSLQEERQRISSTQSESQTRISLRVSSLERQLEETESKLRKAVTERDSLDADRELMKRALQDSSNTVKQLQNQIASLENVQRDVADREKKNVKSHDVQLATLRENLRKLQTQLTSSRNLIKIVQDQRANLQEDNKALRRELDDVLRRSLGTQSGDVASRSIPTLGQAPIMLGASDVERPMESEAVFTTRVAALDPPTFGSRLNVASSPIHTTAPASHVHSAPPPPQEEEAVQPNPADAPSSGESEERDEVAGEGEDDENVARGVTSGLDPLDVDIEKLRREVDELEASE